MLLQPFVLTVLILPTMLRAQSSPSLPGIPEPGLIIYGQVLDRMSGKPVQANTVTFKVTGNDDTVNVAATFVSINGQSFYVAHIPFETRLGGAQTVQKTPNTVVLTTGNTPYTRTATVNGKAAAFKAAGAVTAALNTSSFTDTNAVDPGPFFYRLQVNE